jgi:hypothetical protein
MNNKVITGKMARLLTIGTAAGTIALSMVALAQTLSYSLSINGKNYSSTAIVIKGETYIPLKALQAAGVRSSLNNKTIVLTLPTTGEGGANQITALEGCLNEWMFNGIWRFKVNTFKSFTEFERSGWETQVEIRNGTKSSDIAPASTGFSGISVSLPDGNVIAAENVNALADAPIKQGQGVITTLRFYNEQKLNSEPQKFIMLFQPKAFDINYIRSAFGVSYSVSDPSFRIRLNCTK